MCPKVNGYEDTDILKVLTELLTTNENILKAVFRLTFGAVLSKSSHWAAFTSRAVDIRALPLFPGRWPARVARGTGESCGYNKMAHPVILVGTFSKPLDWTAESICLATKFTWPNSFMDVWSPWCMQWSRTLDDSSHIQNNKQQTLRYGVCYFTFTKGHNVHRSSGRSFRTITCQHKH
jgi:hypothetical protein